MIKDYIQESIELRSSLLQDEQFLQAFDKVIALADTCLQNGNTFLIAGNGGSAADAQHFAAEIVGRYKIERKAYGAIALTTDTSAITSIGNDYSFDNIFSRQIEALGKSGDIFYGISTSGNSQNIINAIQKANEMEIQTVCLLGKDGGKLKGITQHALVVPSDNTPRIQEVHLMLIHILCEEIEKNFKK